MANSARRCIRQPVPWWLAFEDRRDRVGGCIARKRPASRQHFVEYAPERPNVRSLIDDFAPCLLRTHVGGCAENRSGRRRIHGYRWRLLEIESHAIIGGRLG